LKAPRYKLLSNLEQTPQHIKNVELTTFIQDAYDDAKLQAMLEEMKYGEHSVFDTDLKGAHPSEPVRKLYFNGVDSFDYIFGQLDKVYNQERKPFNIRHSFGFIIETQLLDENGEIYYDYRQILSHINDNRQAKACVRDKQTWEEYKELVGDSLRKVIYNATNLSTKNRLIMCHNMLFSIFRLSFAGKGIIGIELFIRNRYINVYNEDNNLCLLLH
jgi:hypothetical protein